jgi:hypothetical protein
MAIADQSYSIFRSMMFLSLSLSRVFKPPNLSQDRNRVRDGNAIAKSANRSNFKSSPRHSKLFISSVSTVSSLRSSVAFGFSHPMMRIL